MMPNHCSITVAGHIGKDAELKYMPNGTAVCNTSIATTTGYGDRECTTWRRLALFGKRAEKAAELWTKGTAIIVSGEEQNRAYESNGETRYSLDVTVDNWSFAGSKPSGAAQPAPQQSAGGGVGADPFGDEIPFSPIRGLVE